jgi:hypothetical protein
MKSSMYLDEMVTLEDHMEEVVVLDVQGLTLHVYRT